MTTKKKKIVVNFIYSIGQGRGKHPIMPYEQFNLQKAEEKRVLVWYH